MHIAHYIQSIDLTQGGVVRAVLDMATLLAKGRPGAPGHRVTVFTQDARDTPDGWTVRGQTDPRPGSPEAVPLGPGGPLLRLRADQARTIKDALADIDVLHIHACWNPANIQLASLARSTSTPYVQSVHGMLDDWSMAQSTLKKKIFLAAGGRKTLRGAALVHCTADAEKAQATKWFAPAEGVTVPLVVDLSDYAELPGPDLAARALAEPLDRLTPADAPLVLFLSRIHYKKGPDVFIDVIAELRDRGLPCRGLIVGPGEDAYVATLREQIRARGLERSPAGSVEIAGPVGGATKVSLYQLADLFLLPTSQENFGFVFPEALASGTPVVTTQGVDTHAELEASGGARIAASRDPSELADLAEPILRDRALASAMGDAGRRWVFDRLDPDQVASLFETTYARAAAGPAVGRDRSSQ